MKCACIAAPIFLLTITGFAPAAALPVEGYRLVWCDEFDGETLDLDKWGYRSLGPRRDAINVKETSLWTAAVILSLRPNARLTSTTPQ